MFAHNTNLRSGELQNLCIFISLSLKFVYDCSYCNKTKISHNGARIINFKTGAVYYFVSDPLHNFDNFFFHFLSY